MKKQWFIKNLIFFALPLLIPILILGMLSFQISQKFMYDDINKNNNNILKQTKENCELILNESDFLKLIFDNKGRTVDELKKITDNNLTYEDIRPINVVKELLNAPVGARSYIDSIYVYFNDNKDSFLTSMDGVVMFNNFKDTSWRDSYAKKDERIYNWTEVRNIQKSSYDGDSKEVVSIYMRFLNSKGVIVLNILQDYFESTFNSLVLLPEQSLIVLNEDNQLIYSNKDGHYIDNLNVKSFIENGDFNKTIEADKKKYTVNQITSSSYNWKFILITPTTSFYKMPFKITEMAGLALIISFLLGLALTFYITQKNYSQLKRILSILESAENGLPLPAYPDRIKDEYGFIMHNMLKTFIEQSYLKMQLSEKKYKLKVMELMALQSQINPHFLFNTLATVSWESIIHMGKENHINTMIENLSDILRYSLENPNETVSLKKEIENTKNYIEIQKFRYIDKFDVIWQCDNYLEDIKVTKLILQPLVENSIYHGIKEKESKSCIKIKIRKDLHYINIAVIDSGIGMTKTEVKEITDRLNSDEERYEHIGLYNINKRLKLIYGNEYSLKIRSKYGFGTAVYIRTPKEIL